MRYNGFIFHMSQPNVVQLENHPSLQYQFYGFLLKNRDETLCSLCC